MRKFPAVLVPVFCAVLGACQAAPPPQAAVGEAVPVFRAKSPGYAGFRIPAIVKAKDGSLLAFAEGRKHHLGDGGDIDLLLAVSHDQGRSWSDPRLIADAGADFIGNPAPVVDAHTGAITVLLTWKVAGSDEGAIRAGKQPPALVYAMRSLDHGATWSKAAPLESLNAELLARGWRWNIPGPGHAIQLARGAHAGRLVCAANHSASGGRGNAFLGGNAFLSDDGGASWRLGAVDEAPAGGRQGACVYPNESAVAEWADGTLVFSTRNEGGPVPAHRGITWSADGGENFTAPYAPDSGLVGPVCQGALLYAPDAAGHPRILATLPADPARRQRLQVRVSGDLGKTWNPGPVLVPGGAMYSDLVELAPGSFYALAETSAGAIEGIPFTLP